MNTLSWLLYAADILSGLKVAAALGSCGATVVMGLAGVRFLVEETTSKNLIKTCLIVLVSCTVVMILTPSKDTVYAIAASQLGEAAAKSTLGQKSLAALEKWLDKQVSEKTK